jgi:predicted RNA methylase
MSQQHFVQSYGGSAPENYERYFVPAIGAPLANDLIGIAALRPGERVLDVACGTGVVARLASQAVGSAGTVAGLDINPGMLAVARSTTQSGMAIIERGINS